MICLKKGEKLLLKKQKENSKKPRSLCVFSLGKNVLKVVQLRKMEAVAKESTQRTLFQTQIRTLEADLSRVRRELLLTIPNTSGIYARSELEVFYCSSSMFQCFRLTNEINFLMDTKD